LKHQGLEDSPCNISGIILQAATTGLVAVGETASSEKLIYVVHSSQMQHTEHKAQKKKRRLSICLEAGFHPPLLRSKTIFGECLQMIFISRLHDRNSMCHVFLNSNFK